MSQPLDTMLYAQYQNFRAADSKNTSYVTWLEHRIDQLTIAGSHLAQVSEGVTRWLKTNHEISNRGMITTLQEAITFWNSVEQYSIKEPNNV